MKEKFIETLKEALEVKTIEVNLEDKLADYDSWDSMSRLSLVALLDENFEVQVADAEFDKTETVEDLYLLVKSRIE
jgi:acyl carrier protein